MPKGVYPIGTKWVFKNKTDERGIVVKNKARLVVLAFAVNHNIKVYKMDI